MRCVLTRGHTAGDRLGANWEREPNLTRRPAASACRTPRKQRCCPNAQQLANGDPREESDYGPYQSNSSLPPAESDIS
jgi:hypothetical protein